jgi:hypothetical protein
MLHALLHRKLDADVHDPHRLEDTLTSVTFGTLVWMEAWDLLAAWFGLSSPDERGRTTGCWFWPTLYGSVEPDVIIRLDSVLVVVEAKFHSGLHNLPALTLHTTAPEEPRASNQLLRQYRGITRPVGSRQRYPDDLERAIAECQVEQVYVIDARRMARGRNDIDESIRALPSGATPQLITWQSLYRALRVHSGSRHGWVRDLLAYLKMVGLDTFDGFGVSLTSGGLVHRIEHWRIVPAPRTFFHTALAPIAASPNVRRLSEWTPSRRTNE